MREYCQGEGEAFLPLYNNHTGTNSVHIHSLEILKQGNHEMTERHSQKGAGGGV